jgi:NTE family protein
VKRALVLGGGGPVGIGWESGLLVGLAAGGVDISGADGIFGTSAGAFVGALLALGADIPRTVAELAAEDALEFAASWAALAAERLPVIVTTVTGSILSGASPEETRRALGRLSVESEVPTEEEFLRSFALFGQFPWPPRFACTAVETASGDFVVWEAGSGTDLLHGVASSCAVPSVFPPVTIEGQRYMDGGVRTTLNADLAVGYERVLVISATTLSPPAGATDPVTQTLFGAIATELAELRSSGAEVVVIEPNQEFLEISGFGLNLMDVRRATDAHEAGIRLGDEEAGRIGGLWDH